MIVSITVNGKAEEQAVKLPSDYATLEELTLAHRNAKSNTARARVSAAMMVLCCPGLLRLAAIKGVTYEAYEFEPLAFGRACYSWLHGYGVSIAEIVTAGNALLPELLTRAFPSEAEVAAEVKKSSNAAPATLT